MAAPVRIGMRQFFRARTSAGLRRALRDIVAEFSLQRRHRTGVKRARELTATRPLRLNLASGFRPRSGWLNIDSTLSSDLCLDLREPLPFPDSCVDAIYTEHFFEHLNYASIDDSTAWELETPSSRSEALTFLRECLRVLVPGGVLDIV